MNIHHPRACLTYASLLALISLNTHAADHSAPAAGHPPGHAKAHWSYSGQGAPAHWGELEPGFSLCKSGQQQSPVDIRPEAANGKPAPLEFSYSASAAEVVNNGHTVQVNLNQAGGFQLEGTQYKLLQFHFHTPSEEKIAGTAYPLVAHMVHKNAAGKLAVVAVLFELGDENKALKETFAHLPGNGKTAQLASGFNPADLLPAYKGYFKFMGSLTTPPCTEDVQWQVLKQRVEISKAQLAAFRALYKMNARPVQAFNNRKIEAS